MFIMATNLLNIFAMFCQIAFNSTLTHKSHGSEGELSSGASALHNCIHAWHLRNTFLIGKISLSTIGKSMVDKNWY